MEGKEGQMEEQVFGVKWHLSPILMGLDSGLVGLSIWIVLFTWSDPCFWVCNGDDISLRVTPWLVCQWAAQRKSSSKLPVYFKGEKK